MLISDIDSYEKQLKDIIHKKKGTKIKKLLDEIDTLSQDDDDKNMA